MAKPKKIDELALTVRDLGLNVAVLRLIGKFPVKYRINAINRINSKMLEFVLLWGAEVHRHYIREELLDSMKWDKEIKRLEVKVKQNVSSKQCYEIFFYVH